MSSLAVLPTHQGALQGKWPRCVCVGGGLGFHSQDNCRLGFHSQDNSSSREKIRDKKQNEKERKGEK